MLRHRRVSPKFVYQSTWQPSGTIGTEFNTCFSACARWRRTAFFYVRSLHDLSPYLPDDTHTQLRFYGVPLTLAVLVPPAALSHHAGFPRSGTGKLKSLVKKTPPLILPQGLCISIGVLCAAVKENLTIMKWR